jgi:hypothetical protein
MIMTSGNNLTLQQRRVVLGALLAASFFLIEAGVVEIILGLDQQCRREVSALRLAPDPFSVCMSEWQWLYLHAASRGFLWLFNRSTPILLAGITMGFFYALVGAMIANFFKRGTVLVYLAVQLFLIALVAGLSYLGQFIA